jgi:altronate dehydratase
MSENYDVPGLEALGRVPLPGDNAAIAIRNLDAGTRFFHDGAVHSLSHSILEGHRFAIAPLKAGDYLLSWNLPFGRALRAIKPGEYLCNAGVLDALRVRDLDFTPPEVANFQNASAAVRLEGQERYGQQVPLYEFPRTFPGYDRGTRGIGTRNYIVILGTTSSTSSFARMLAEMVSQEAKTLANVDGIVAIAHTEGSGALEANNLEFVLRTLAGFAVHPNVAALLAVDLGTEQVSNARLQGYLREHHYPIEGMPHHFYTLRQDISTSLEECTQILRGWYEQANSVLRSEQPLSGLRIGLQCGGSDAFSGISANPLAGWVAKEIIRHGGAANLAETDELIGAEGYVLANVRDEPTARRFLDKLKVFSERIAWHGHSAEGNPTAGNTFRGLYNISLKSIGAARKKDPQLRLDRVIDYAQPMSEPGFYFMDSPGNDLESVAGQVGAGCNMIFFTTGNGSITNFPFVPTIKFVTTTRRWDLLSQDMDVNAGRYLDGEKMDDLGREGFEYAVRVASGMPSAGERAKHSQVSIWRNWQQTDASRLDHFRTLEAPGGKPIPVDTSLACVPANLCNDNLRTIGLILPTSLCSGQIALRIAAELNQHHAGATAVSRFVSLPHTEGCGASTGENEDHFLRTVVGHLLHPMVSHALLLEHGCERTHNALIRRTLTRYGVDPARFGYASIQLDGGIDKVTAIVKDWFARSLSGTESIGGSAQLPLGLISQGAVAPQAARALAQVITQVLSGGGSVVVPRSASFLQCREFLDALGSPDVSEDTLAYAQIPQQPGLHVMATPTQHFVEAITGLGATGVGVILAYVDGYPVQGHPMIPTIQVTARTVGPAAFASDFDLIFERATAPEELRDAMLALLRETVSECYVPRAWARGNHDFQVTRGHLGVSL